MKLFIKIAVWEGSPNWLNGRGVKIGSMESAEQLIDISRK